MEYLKELVEASDEWLSFMDNYIEMIRSFNYAVETYTFKSNNLALRNTDLWIEAYIDFIPELQGFRDHVRQEMDRLGVYIYGDIVYEKKHNHFYYNHKRDIEELRTKLTDKA